MTGSAVLILYTHVTDVQTTLQPTYSGTYCRK